MTDDLKEAVERLERDLELQDGGGMAYTCHDGLYTVVIQGEDLRLVLSALKAAERPQPVPGDGETERIARIFHEASERPTNIIDPPFDCVTVNLKPSIWRTAADLLSRLQSAERERDGLKVALNYERGVRGEHQDQQARAEAAERDRDALKAERDAWNRRSEPRGDSPLAPEGAPQLGLGGNQQAREVEPSSGGPTLHCSFCHLSHREVPYLLAGDCGVFICSGCVEAAAEVILAQRKARAEEGAPAERNACPVTVDDRKQAASEASEPPTPDGADKPVEGEGG